MKEFVFIYNGKDGKKHVARAAGKTEAEAAANFEATSPGLKHEKGIEVDPLINAMLNVLPNVSNDELKELAMIQADVNTAKAAQDAADRTEERRKSKFLKYMNTGSVKFDEQAKDALLQAADDFEKNDKDFDRQVWNKLLATSLSTEEQRVMQKEFEEDAKKHWGSDKVNLNRELEAIRVIFNDTKGKWSQLGNALTFDQIATAMGNSKQYAIKVFKQGLAKLAAKILKTNNVTPEQLKVIEDRITKMNSDARKNKDAKTVQALERKAKAAEREFNQLLKELNAVQETFGLEKSKYYARKFPKTISRDAAMDKK